MTCGFWSSPAIAKTGSPGSIFCRPKIIIDTRISVGIATSARLAMIRSMNGLPLDAHATQTDQPVRIGREALHFLRQRIRPRLRVQIDDRVFTGEDLLRGVVDRLAFRDRRFYASIVEQLVDIRVAITPVVQITLTGHELMQVAIGVRAARPAEIQQFE